MTSAKRITRAFLQAKKIELKEDSKFILFSDCHRGDNSFADDFSRNRAIYHFALSSYLEKEFTYVELGDGDELWENNFADIFNANKDIYLLLKQFHDKGRLHFIWGNHDMKYRKKKAIEKNFDFYFDSAEDQKKELMPNLDFSEAITLTREDGKSIFLLHGHQADPFNYIFWKLSKFLVRYLWRPLQIIGIKDPTSPAQNHRELIKVEKRLQSWVRQNNNQMLIAGHTHRPRFPTKTEAPYFNDGSCVHPRCITGIEIEKDCITLVKWFFEANADGLMEIKRTALEGPSKLHEYM
ncbi:metallophosphoesterase [Tenacibaculum sp. SG-28]|uniref:metallophosphoesterase n=1 Tax=Tenacibaculum sp. SG-28 TaxID=754426 RepID=UPI000CF50A13|nr:metallophosphoesterase [Tenacibaculum sp. SG-28]PQJ21681.1 serine/threonine protein phosphatase [Tenacibaculum sp. SG-28]